MFTGAWRVGRSPSSDSSAPPPWPGARAMTRCRAGIPTRARRARCRFCWGLGRWASWAWWRRSGRPSTGCRARASATRLLPSCSGRGLGRHRLFGIGRPPDNPGPLRRTERRRTERRRTEHRRTEHRRTEHRLIPRRPPRLPHRRRSRPHPRSEFVGGSPGRPGRYRRLVGRSGKAGDDRLSPAGVGPVLAQGRCWVGPVRG
jgi:hypothetical protein